jgi:RNA polymerase sigma factor (sigma-70 family)
MSGSPETRVSLLLRLKDSRDYEAWNRFVAIYAPVVYEYGRRHCLQDADAADLTQEVLRAVSRSAGRFCYDPQRGSFRSWLFTVARTKRINLEVQGSRHPRGTGDTGILEQMREMPDRDSDEAEAREWDRAYEQRLFEWAAEQVRPEFKEATWQAFQRTAIERVPSQQVADDLKMTLGAIYAAKSRVLGRIREVIRLAQLDEIDDRGTRT